MKDLPRPALAALYEALTGFPAGGMLRWGLERRCAWHLQAARADPLPGELERRLRSLIETVKDCEPLLGGSFPAMALPPGFRLVSAHQTCRCIGVVDGQGRIIADSVEHPSATALASYRLHYGISGRRVFEIPESKAPRVARFQRIPINERLALGWHLEEQRCRGKMVGSWSDGQRSQLTALRFLALPIQLEILMDTDSLNKLGIGEKRIRTWKVYRPPLWRDQLARWENLRKEREAAIRNRRNRRRA